MCGRATLSVSPDELREMFALTELPELTPRFNIAPSQPLPIIRTLGRLELATWGRRFINVRVERATMRPENRCLVIVDGFYEWRDTDKQPFYFRRVDGKPFALGGVTKGDEAAIVTCAAHEGVVELHDRMPVVLTPENWKRWLGGERLDGTLIGTERYPVSRLVNSTKNDDARNIEPTEAEITKA